MLAQNRSLSAHPSSQLFSLELDSLLYVSLTRVLSFEEDLLKSFAMKSFVLVSLSFRVALALTLLTDLSSWEAWALSVLVAMMLLSLEAFKAS